MNVCVVYFSRTGNTRRLAQAIADTAKAPIYDLASAGSSDSENCDLLILGTPVEGSSPTKEAVAFIENLPNVKSKKAILFCTYRFFGSERVFKIMEKMLGRKGLKRSSKSARKA
jgi:flavodoxin